MMDGIDILELSRLKDEYLRTLDDSSMSRLGNGGRTPRDDARTEICGFLYWLERRDMEGCQGGSSGDG